MNGVLKVSGNKLVNSSGKPVQLRGMSLFWSQWDPYFWNAATVKWLHDDWKCNAVRAAVGIEKDGGYKMNKQANLTKLYTLIDAAIASGMYVVIDAHTHTAHTEVATIKDFFTTIITKYKGLGKLQHLLYEPFNEPTNPFNTGEGGAQSWSGDIKPYHNDMISHIRGLDSAGVILCGTEEWDTKLAKAFADPVSGTNIMYVFHYYAAQHIFSGTQAGELKAAVSKMPLFVAEYGTVMAPGNGSVNPVESKKYWDLVDANMISYMNWSVFNKDEAASAIAPGVTARSGWTDAQLTISGKLVRAHYIARNSVDPIDGISVNTVDGIDENNKLFISPNPLNNNFSIAQDGEFDYTISDLTGKL